MLQRDRDKILPDRLISEGANNDLDLLTNFRRRIYLKNNLYTHVFAKNVENKALKNMLICTETLEAIKEFAINK